MINPLKQSKMTDLEKQLDNLVNQFGIDEVMCCIKNNHADKVFIPNWYYQEHLENMGFKFDDKYFDMFGFDEFMQDHGINDLTNQLISDDYPFIWEEYKEENS